MRIIILISVFLAGLLHAGDVLLNFPIANLTDNGYVLCSVTTYGENGPVVANVQNACGGTTAYVGCRTVSASNAVVLARGNKTDIFNSAPNGVLSYDGNARFYHYAIPAGRVGFVNNSEPVPTDCLTAASPTGMCWNLNSTRVISGGTCGTVYTTAFSVERVVLTNPCEGLTPGSPCVRTKGLCETGGICSANLTCINAVDVAPPALDQCQASATCDPLTGLFTFTNKFEGEPCNSTNVCTFSDTCDGLGNCTDGIEIFCPPAPQCQISLGCTDPIGCQYSNAADGSFCDDGSAATSPDTCQSGVCVPGPIAPCPIGPLCTGPGVRSNVTGNCEYSALPNGTPCTYPDPCSQTAECQAAVCVITVNVTCGSPQSCFAPGVCIPGTGCQSAPLPVGTACDDGNPCTTGSTCNSLNQCSGGTPTLSCPAPSQCLFNAVPQNISNVCQCPMVFPPRADGTPCEDNDLCTTNSVCIGGGCAGGSPVSCPGDQCNFPTTCNSLTGCYNPRPDGTACVLSNPCLINTVCDDGECVGTLDTSNSFCNSANGLGSILEWIIAA